MSTENSTEKPKVAIKASEVSFGPPPDLRHRGGSGEAGSVITTQILDLPAPDGEGENLRYASVFIAGVEKTSQVSAKLTEMRKRGDIIDDIAQTVRVFTCKVLFEKHPETGEDVKGVRIWRLPDEPIKSE